MCHIPTSLQTCASYLCGYWLHMDFNTRPEKGRVLLRFIFQPWKMDWQEFCFSCQRFIEKILQILDQLFNSGGNKWVRPCQSHRKITVWIWRPAHLLDRLALDQSCVRPFSRLDIAIILNVYCCTVFDWVMQTLKHMTAVSLMFTFCATIIFFSTNISTATAFNCFSPRKCWRRAWWEIPAVYKPSQSVAKNL